ncbi:hypothetical protein ABH926_005943 [Catenulispora sp. GP43]|uniref:hypothetical protein n=1 Tax=Catenulispora sp. GP43 TaxID=3156263 RepID=UPI0035153BAF
MSESVSLAESWILGVAANPAAPPDVLLRLLDEAGEPAWTLLCEDRPLPAELVEAVLASPHQKVRRAFARNPYADPADRGRLVTDPDPMVRIRLAGGPRRSHLLPIKPLPDAVLETLLLQDGMHGNDLFTAYECQQELFFSQQVPRDFLRGLIHHQNPALRVHSTRILFVLTDDERQVLLADPDPIVRQEARGTPGWDAVVTSADLPEKDCHARFDRLTNSPVSRDVIEACIASRRNLTTLARNRHTPPDIVARLARDPDPKVREEIAGRHDLDAVLLAELARDPDGGVRSRALPRPRPATDADRKRIDFAYAGTADQIGRDDWPKGGLDPDWIAACAVSPHPLMRRVAAIDSSVLPADLVELLAHDPDPHVRHLLAYNHPAASAELLLEAFIAGPRQRKLLLTRPALPRTGLADLLTHADPGVRALAAADTTLDEPPYAQLTDPDHRVRCAAAANPLLPAEWIATLLDDPDLAEAAAANPALTAEQLHEVLDRAAMPRR